jgi:outer membrane protein OmpA-like peptidoglycan-associated protein
MSNDRRVRGVATASVTRLLSLVALLAWGAAMADPPAPVVDSQSIVRSLAPSSAPASTTMTRGFSVEAAPGGGGASASHKIDLDIRFANDSAQLTDSAHEQLAQLGAALQSTQLAHARFQIGGHTSATGAAEHNQHLSESRAKAVRAYLLQRFNISPGRIEAIGYGSSRPLPQFPPSSIQQRRVEITTLPAS